MESFVVLGSYEYGADESINVLYVGNNKEEAMSFQVDTHYHTLELEVWVSGVMIKSYSKTDIHRWTLEYDKLKQLEEAIEEKKSEIEDMEHELNLLTALIEEN